MKRHLLSVLLPVFLIGCSNSGKGIPARDTGDEDTDTEAPDNDLDGYPADVDCDDDDPDSYPGAPELCDGVDNDCDGDVPETEGDLDGDGVVECEETCGAGPIEDTIGTLSDCEYVPSTSGTPFLAQVEWAMTQEMTDPTTGNYFPGYTWAEHDGFGAVFQAPTVFHATDDDFDGTVDDNDVPDIAVVMAHPDEYEEGVLRLISGDGSAVHDSAHWLPYGNGYDYAPYHYAGTATADLDGDGAVEIATTLIRDDGLCFPGYYEVVQSGTTTTLELDRVWEGANYFCAAHAPAVADIDDDGAIELIWGKAVFDAATFTQEWYGDSSGGRGWYPQAFYEDGYWNSGYHSFAYDVTGDGATMEIVAGNTVYTHDGDILCELGSYDNNTWSMAKDGYPAVADMLGNDGVPEIVVTGNNDVSVYSSEPVNGRCELIASVPNDPNADENMPSGLPAHPNCDESRKAFGGQPTVSDFDGDGDNEVAVAGACYYTVYHFDESDNDTFKRYAMAETKDWSSASTGSTVFDFNGDGESEVVFSDEEALYVWGVDDSPGLMPWERLFPYLVDENHKSWTIHEYPLVADLDADGKAEILVANSHLPGYEGHFGLYALGAVDDDWVSARQVWHQHAYHVTNVSDDFEVGYAAPNYSPYTSENYNSFRQQAPGSFGATSAPNLFVEAEAPCQEGCGDVTLWVSVGNEGENIAASKDVVISIYGVKTNGSRELVDSKPLGKQLDPGTITAGISFTVSGWDKYKELVAVVDDPAITGPLGGEGLSKECDELDNETIIELTGLCP